ncbi:hypothetical protein [uncultured Tenacibaculum sp.]|uniref:hypothetical protein n=1 Tax=uncultured Tenacibaculum sp. TaxID=174713 RepID=UPI0026148960|nr:hypothetical protein [uncultured Tenacibaculum sp.]
MKYKILILFFLIILNTLQSQVLPGTPVSGLPSGTTAQITSIVNPIQGLILYSTDEKILYYYNGTIWISLSNSSSLLDSNVNLAIAQDVNNISTDPGAVNETTVQGVIQAIAPITSKAARIFYPPSVAIDASTIGNGKTLNLYNEYISQFGSPAVKSNSAPNTIPTYLSNELYYYVTAYDTSVLTITNINDSGVMTYNVNSIPSNDNTIINVVFVVK